MALVNEHFLKLPGSYLFSDIAKKINTFKITHPKQDIIRLGIGDVTRPLPPVCIEAMHKAVDEMADESTFRGYGPEQGYDFLIEAILKMTSPREASTSLPRKSSSTTVPRAIRATSANCCAGTTAWVLPTPFTPSMWTATSCADARACWAKTASGATSLTCPARKRTISFPNCPPTGSTCSTCAIPTTRREPH